MTEHTPGPWTVVSGAVETTEMGGIPIANMDREPGNGTLPVERDANARLMATAPELLDICQHIMSVYIGPQPMSTDTLDMLRAAIAKATGAVDDSLVPDKATSDDLMPDESGQDEPDGAGAEPDLMGRDFRETMGGYPEAGR